MTDEKFEAGKMPFGFDPNNPPADFDPGKLPPPPDFFGENDAAEEEVENVFHQKDPAKWLRQPPKVIRGDMKNAFKAGRAADKMQCNCWNRKCPFFGDCRKCIAFHMALKQIPTCQRDMVVELYKEGILYEELYIKEELEREAQEKAAQENN